MTADLMTAVPTDHVSLRRTWVDPAPGIEMVQIHYAWTPAGGQPDWEDVDTRVLTPSDASPGLRSAVIEVPRRVRFCVHR